MGGACMILPFYAQRFAEAPLGTVEFFVGGSGTGTDIPKNIYADLGLTNPLPNPIELDALGYLPQYFVESGNYYIVVRNRAGNIILTRDQVAAVEPSGGGGGGGDTFTVKTSAGDPAAAFLGAKLASTSIEITEEDGGSGKRLRLEVDPAAVQASQLFEVESFKFGEGQLVRDAPPELWTNTDAKGCFCWIQPCAGWKRLAYIKTTFCAWVFGWEPQFAIWGWAGSPLDEWVKLADDSWHAPHGLVPVNILDIDVTPYKWVKVATDPGPLLAPEWVKQTGVVYPPAVTASPFPSASGFIGGRTSWLAPFGDDFPTILAGDPRYLVTKWIALGVKA